jgi:glyceraldehyde-3-phosphate dehydrogenase/erythrose-4-phosphate dehydrogenase
LVINQNLQVMEDQVHHQEMERKKVLVIKENLVLPKKMIQDQLVLQITPSILEENHQKAHQQILIKKVMVLKEKRNLRVEVTGLKTLLLKSTVKKGLKSKFF